MGLIFLWIVFGICNAANAMFIAPDEHEYSSQCPKEQPFRNPNFTNSKCKGCDYLREIEIKPGHEKDFDICSNRKLYNHGDGFYSMLKECPEGTFKESFLDDYVRCFSCNEKMDVSSSEEECNKCRNRKWINDEWMGSLCVNCNGNNCPIKETTK